MMMMMIMTYPDYFDHFVLFNDAISVDVIKPKRQLQFFFRRTSLCYTDRLQRI